MWLAGRIKLALSVACLIAVAIYLAPADPATKRKYPNRIPVVFWHTFNGEWLPIYSSMIDRFNQSQTKYEVIGLALPDSDSTMKFLMSEAGGDSPDIIMSYAPILGTWSDGHLIRPYDDIMSAAEKREFERRTYPIVLQNAKYKGKIMAMIDGLDLFAMYYRLDDLKEVGVDENHLPKTMEELVALGHKLDRLDSHHHLQRIGFLPRTFPNLTAVFGGTLNRNGHIVINTPENLRAMEFINDGTRRYGFDDVIRFTSSLAADAGPTMPLIAGNYSIMYDGEWRVKQVDQYQHNLRYALAPAPPPAGGKPNASISGPNYLVIPTACKQPQGAWEFAKFCVGFLHPEDGGQNMADMGWLPDDPMIAKAKTYQAYLRRYPKYRVFVNLMSSPNLTMNPQGPLQSFVSDEIGKVEDSVIRGDISPQQALVKLESEMAEEKARLRRLGQVYE